MKLLLLRALLHRRHVASLLALVIGASFVGSAWAGDGHGARMRAQAVRQAPFAARGMRPERPVAAARAQQAREQAAQPQPMPQAVPVERAPETPQFDRGGRPGRLTPEERRALRQQINDAGRDIYRPPRP